MESVINYENLRRFTYSNDKLVTGEVTGIVIEFTGLGKQEIINMNPPRAAEYASEGIIYLLPYYNPWAWMNMQTVAFVERLVDVVAERYSLSDGVRVAVCGHSMGGLGALVYPCYSKYKIVAVSANCPVCDLPYMYGERRDTPRTIYSAFAGYDAPTLEDAMKTASPAHIIEKMPRADYLLFRCTLDDQVSGNEHSGKFVDAMRERGHKIELITVTGHGHCDLPQEDFDRFYNHLSAAIENS